MNEYSDLPSKQLELAKEKVNNTLYLKKVKLDGKSSEKFQAANGKKSTGRRRSELSQHANLLN